MDVLGRTFSLMLRKDMEDFLRTTGVDRMNAGSSPPDVTGLGGIDLLRSTGWYSVGIGGGMKSEWR